MSSPGGLPRPFEVDVAYLEDHLDEMVDVTFADLQSQFLVMPRGPGFVDYHEFQNAYEVLKRHTAAFSVVTEATLWAALNEDALTLLVIRTILGFTPSEWAEAARDKTGSDIDQGYARTLDSECRSKRGMYSGLTLSSSGKRAQRTAALLKVAANFLIVGAPDAAQHSVHRLAKVDTADGLRSLQHVAANHVPYAVLLYERYLGRPFASHRDAVSEMVGDVMESAIEERLSLAQITYRKTKRAEAIPGFPQAPDFIVPDEYNPSIVIEAKIANDDGTARDKVTRINSLANNSDERVRNSIPGFQVIACIDGRGFGVRRQMMRDVLLRTGGKVFTLATLDQMIPHTDLSKFLPDQPTAIDPDI